MEKNSIENMETIFSFLGFGSESWVPLIAAIIGGVLTILGQLVIDWVKTRSDRKLRGKRKELLKQMLNNPGDTGWRTMYVMSGVVGLSREDTASLLVEIDARRSTGDKDVWAYIKDKPLPENEGDPE